MERGRTKSFIAMMIIALLLFTMLVFLFYFGTMRQFKTHTFFPFSSRCTYVCGLMYINMNVDAYTAR